MWPITQWTGFITTNSCSRARAASIFTAILWSACSIIRRTNSSVRHAPGRLQYYSQSVVRVAKSPLLAGSIKPARPTAIWFAHIARIPC